METKHTPLPWSYELDMASGKRGGDRSTLFLFFSEGPSVKFVSLPPTEEMVANTQLIVKTVNLMPEVERVLKLAKQALYKSPVMHQPNCQCVHCGLDDLLAKLRESV